MQPQMKRVIDSDDEVSIVSFETDPDSAVQAVRDSMSKVALQPQMTSSESSRSFEDTVSRMIENCSLEDNDDEETWAKASEFALKSSNHGISSNSAAAPNDSSSPPPLSPPLSALTEDGGVPEEANNHGASENEGDNDVIDDFDDELYDDEDSEEELSSIPCPVCRYKTIYEAGTFEECLICSWEDDGCPEERADEAMGDPNKDYSLNEARRNFAAFLTMYRPQDWYLFLRATEHEVLLRKERVCIAMEERGQAPDDDDLWIELDQALPRIEEARMTANSCMEQELKAFNEEQQEALETERKAIEARAKIETIEFFNPSLIQAAPTPKKKKPSKTAKKKKKSKSSSSSSSSTSSADSRSLVATDSKKKSKSSSSSSSSASKATASSKQSSKSSK